MKFTLQNVPISRITGNNLARSQRDAKRQELLNRSVAQFTVLQPVLIQKKGETYTLIAGFGRVEACKANGIENIPAQVYEGDLPAIDLLILAANENNVREGADFLDIADTLERVMKAKKIPAQKAGELLGLTQPVVSKIQTASAMLSDEAKLIISEEKINYSIAYILSKAKPELQAGLIRRYVDEKWNRERLQKEVKGDSMRLLTYGDVVKFSLSFPVNATYEVIEEAIKKLQAEVAKCKRIPVPFELLPKMVQAHD